MRCITIFLGRGRLSIALFLVITIGSAAVIQAQSVNGVTQPDANTVRCALSNGSAVDFEPANPYMVRVEYRQNNNNSTVSELMDSSYTSTETFTSTSLTTDPIVLTGPNYSVSIARTTFSIVFRNSGGTTLFSSTGVSQSTVNGTIISGTYYGVHNTSTNNNGGGLTITIPGTVQIYVATQVRQGGAASPIAWTPQGFGILVDAEEGSFNFASTTTLNITRTTANCKNTNCLFWLMAGTPVQIMSCYYKASGSYGVPPKFTCGFMNCEWGLNETELRSIINGYRSRNIPLDVYILDYDWFNYNQTNNGDFKWSTSKFPSSMNNVQAWPVGGDLKKWADSNGIKFVGIRKPHGVWTGISGCADFYQDTIRRKFWENLVDPSYDSHQRGIIAYWNDEADDCSNGNKPFMFLYMMKSLYWGQRYNTRSGWPQYHNDRVWGINRNYYGGSQKYAYAMWSGDCPSSNQSMQDNRKWMVSSQPLGCAWWSMDIGGFMTSPTNDDFQHWMQFGAFVPIFRVHGNNNQQRQPWSYGATAEAVATNVIRLRYTFIPYIYSAYWKLHRDGVPLVRPLIMDYPADNNVTNTWESWMFGDNMFVSPIVTNYSATTKSIYVPAGSWYNFWTDAAVTGGGNVSIPVTGMGDTFPILVKSGAIIPRSPVNLYINNYPLTQNNNYAVVPVNFHVYGGANSTYDYTDDDGVTYDYESGEYRYIQYTHTTTATSEQVAIGAKQGSYTPVADSNGYFIFHGISWNPMVVTVQSGDISSNRVTLAALPGTAAPAWARDSARRMVHVKVANPFTSGVVYIGQQTGVIANAVVKDYLEKATMTALKGRIMLHVTLAGQDGLTVRLMNCMGAAVKEYRFRATSEGEHSFSLSTDRLPQGAYFALLSTGDCKVIKKIVVAR
jgi:alpha-glucosidase